MKERKLYLCPDHAFCEMWLERRRNRSVRLFYRKINRLTVSAGYITDEICRYINNQTTEGVRVAWNAVEGDYKL